MMNLTFLLIVFIVRFVLSSLMLICIAPGVEPFATRLAEVRSVAAVAVHVHLEVVLVHESFLADWATVPKLPLVHAHVVLETR